MANLWCMCAGTKSNPLRTLFVKRKASIRTLASWEGSASDFNEMDFELLLLRLAEGKVLK